MVCQWVSCCWLSDKRRPRTEGDHRNRLMQPVCVKRLMVLTDENDDSYKQALNGETDLHIPKRSLKIVLVSLPDPPPGEIEEQVNIKNELPVLLQKFFQPISPLEIYFLKVSRAYGISGDSALTSRISSGTFIKFDEDTCDSSEVKTSRCRLLLGRGSSSERIRSACAGGTAWS